MLEEQAKVRAIYEELVLKKSQPSVVQIGTIADIKKAVPAGAAPANANGNGHSNGNGAEKTETAEAATVAGD